MIDKDKISKLLSNIEEDIEYVKTISDEIVSKRTQDLDELMCTIQEDIVVADNASDEILEKYFLELTNALYFINTRCEFMGFYEDISKSSAKLAYNKAYSDNQIKNASMGLKTTVADNQLYAENESLNENLMSLIYSRSFKIIKTKVDAAQEMVKTLSKLISSHMQEKQMSMFGTKDLQNSFGFSSKDEHN